MQWNMGLDIGQSGIRMAIAGRGIQYRQSSAISYRPGDPETFAVGNDALRLLGRTPDTIITDFPMRGNAIHDEQLLSRWYTYLFKLTSSKNLVKRPRVLLSCPPDMQLTPMRHLVALCMEAGAVACSVVRSDAAAALGAPIDINRPQATLVVEMGAGHMSASLLSGGRVVRAKSQPTGLQSVNDTIIRRMRKQRGIVIGQSTAEELKLALIGADHVSAPSATIHALDANTSFPREFNVPAEDVKDAAEGVVSLLLELIHQVLDHAPAELCGDLNESGIVLTGGGAHLSGLDRVIAERFSLACHLPEDPSGCVVSGLLSIMDAPDKYEHLTSAQSSILKR